MRLVNSYGDSWRETSRAAAETAVRTAWEQWAALGSLARPARDGSLRSIVDPEALILVSLTFEERERRLGDMVRWWARVGASLTSVQRMRTLVPEFGPDAPRCLERFSRWASDAGDRRWTRHAGEAAPADAGTRPRDLKGPAELTLLEPATLMLRMRAAFGVGAKSDVLTYLIGRQGSHATVLAISDAVGYTTTAVRSALKDMSLARLIRETDEHPARYRTSHQPWVDLLDLEGRGHRDGPGWATWSRLFGLLVSAVQIADRVTAGGSEHVAASAARDATEEAAPALEALRIELPEVDRFPGRAFADAMREVVESVAAWSERNR